MRVDRNERKQRRKNPLYDQENLQGKRRMKKRGWWAWGMTKRM